MFMRNFKLFMRVVSALLSFTMAVYPFHSFGITNDPGAVGREGQAYGKQLSNSFSFPVQNGGLIEFGDGETIHPDDLAPRGDGLYVDQPDMGDLQGAYDSERAMEGIGMGAQGRLYEDASKDEPSTISGSVYKIVLGVSAAREQFPDLTNDPIVVGSGEAMVDQGLLDSFGDCSVETEINETSRPVRVPEPEYCTRVTAPQGDQSCTIISNIRVTDTQQGAATLPRFTRTCVPDQYIGWNIDVTNIDFKQYVNFNEVCPNGLDSPGGLYDPMSWGWATGKPVPSQYSNSFFHPTVSATCANNLIGSIHTGYFTNSCTGAWKSGTTGAGYMLYGGFTSIGNEWGPQECISRAVDRNASLAKIEKQRDRSLFAYLNPLNTDMGEFIKPGGFGFADSYLFQETQNNAYDKGFCSTTATVTRGAINNTECVTVTNSSGNNTQLCPGDNLYNQLKPSPIPGIPKNATEVTVTSSCSGFNQGQMDCYEDINGDLQCPYNDGANLNECREFEEDPTCSFIKSECIEGARGEESGHCYAYEDEYDCGVTVNIPSYEKTDSFSCGGPVRCMGADCLDPMKPPSAAGDFGKAAALLDAAESMSQDMECNPDGTGCRVFSGDAEECKTAVGGWVNCCEKPKGVSLSDYITVIRAAPKFNSAMNSLAQANNPMSSIGKGYQAIANPVGQSFQTITKPVAGYVDNISTAIKGMKDSAFETIDKIATKVSTSVKNTLGRSAGSGAGTAAAEQAGESVLTTIMNSPAMAFLQTVMMIYTIYVVVNVIVNLIWKCTKDEFELGTKRQLKSCSKVGSYCKKKILGACIEKRQSFCCFSAPLPRIMQEQMRPQLGMSFGPAKSPDCSGIPVERFGEINWDRINLDEWLGILQATNNFPATSGLNIENMTGAGSNFDTSGGRMNSLDRNLDRLEGVDPDAARKEAAKTVPITTGAPTN